jgi:hypothetical protein
MPSEYDILTNEGGFLDKFEQAHLDTLSARDDAINSIGATGGVDYVVTSITERDNLSASSGEVALVLNGNTGDFYEFDGTAWNQKGPTVRDISLGPTTVSQLSDLRSTSSTSTGELVQVSSDGGGLFVAKASDPFGNGDDGIDVLQASDGTWWVRRAMLGGRTNASNLSKGIVDRKRLSIPSNQQFNVPNDYATIQDALDDLPQVARKEYVINVDDGTYNEDLLVEGLINASWTDGVFGQSAAGENGQVQVIGNINTPSNVKVDSVALAGLVGSAVIQFWGIEWSGDPTPYTDEDTPVFAAGDGEAFFGFCNYADGTASEGSVCYSGRMHIRQGNFGTLNYSNGITVKRGGFVTAQDNVGTVSDTAFNGVDPGGIFMFKNFGTLTGDVSTFDAKKCIFKTQSHRQIGGTVDYSLRDDWGDNNVNGRSGSLVREAHYTNPGGDTIFNAEYRPDWNVTTGNPSSSNGQLILPAGDGVNYTKLSGGLPRSGNWKMVFQFNSNPSSGELSFDLVKKDFSNKYRLNLAFSGYIELVKTKGGTDTRIINVDQWNVDTNKHVVEVKRTLYDEWEVLFDGATVGTATDSFLPSGFNVEFFNGLDAQVNIETLNID